MFPCPKCGFLRYNKPKLRRQVKKLVKEGLTQSEIGLYLDISQGYVSRLLNKKR